MRSLAFLLGWVCLPLGGSLDAQSVYAVHRVVDGDTVVLEGLGTVRLIGVDTPETKDPRKPVQHYGIEAADFLRSTLGGQAVRVEYDQQRLDKYRRTLAYLFLADGTFVNREIIRQGYGHAYLTYPFIYADAFRAAEREARESNRGLWAEPQQAQPAASGPVRVWANTSSRVYHCAGTRYYGNTARGEYLAEGEAQKQGHRPAGGKVCGPLGAPPTAQATTGLPKPAALAMTSAPAVGIGGGDVRVWVNTSSGVYHCPGTRYYGSTKNGRYVSQQDAETNGHRPAAGRRCS